MSGGANLVTGSRFTAHFVCGVQVRRTADDTGGIPQEQRGRLRQGLAETGVGKDLGEDDARAAQDPGLLGGITAVGRLWVKSEAPNVPKFTDDDGNDYGLNGNSVNDVLSGQVFGRRS